MRAVVQRVNRAEVSIDGRQTAQIQKGLVVLLGVAKEDSEEDVKYLSDKIVNLRIFADSDKNMNISGLDIGAEILVVSQFTLYGDSKKGKRPDFTCAAEPKKAEELYNCFVNSLRQYPLKVQTGTFAAMMVVSLDNDGPVTLILESKRGT
ncbi:MAG: D-aminoacyl-tRNA deacylase [bacterium]